jgi:hypothetical protein
MENRNMAKANAQSAANSRGHNNNTVLCLSKYYDGLSKDGLECGLNVFLATPRGFTTTTQRYV